MCVRVFSAEIMRIVGGDEWDVELIFETKEVFLDFAFCFEALVLNLEIEVSAAEDVLVFESYGLGFLITSWSFSGEDFAELTGETALGGDEAFGVLREIALGYPRLAIEAVERSFRRDADEIAIAFFVFGED